MQVGWHLVGSTVPPSGRHLAQLGCGFQRRDGEIRLASLLLFEEVDDRGYGLRLKIEVGVELDFHLSTSSAQAISFCRSSSLDGR